MSAAGATPGPGALLPHGPPARWIDEVIARTGGELVCRGRIPAASPFARGGIAPALAGIELAAQAAAVLEALERAGAETGAGAGSGAGAMPRRGYLVRVRDAALATAGIPAEAPLIARVRRIGGLPPLAFYEVEVRREDGGEAAEVCRGTLATWLAEEDGAGPGDAGQAL